MHTVETETPKVEPIAATPTPAVVPDPPKESQVVCGPHDPSTIYNILRKEGLNHIAAANQTGSWMTESTLNQCQTHGDGGIAWGLNSWHPGRRKDMPMNLEQQIHWAVHIEMPRDCRSCYDQLMNASSDWEAQNAIQKSTRWGYQGARWSHAARFSTTFRP